MGAAEQPSFREALRSWFRLDWFSFSGPAGRIAIMHKDLVERKKLIPVTVGSPFAGGARPMLVR